MIKKTYPKQKRMTCTRCNSSEYTYMYNKKDYICLYKCNSRPLEKEERQTQW